MSIFQPHGQYSMSVSGRIFHVKCKGAWNAETMKLYASDALERTKHLFGQPWAMISDIDEWELATPDVEPILIWLLDQGVKNGLVREAVVNNHGRIKLKQFNVSMPNDPRFERKMFTTEVLAKEWLSNEGFVY